MRTLIQVLDVVKRHGPHVVLDRARATFSDGRKIGVVGRNGAGKTTLLRIIVGDEAPDAGEVVRDPALRLGYLEQHSPLVMDETAEAFLMRYADAPPWKAAKVASAFAIKGEMLRRTVGAMSEGERMRLRLAGLALKEPNFLVLDEPTNFLDLRTQILLEAFLRGFRGGYLVVSHDREFLKRTCDETLEVDRGRLASFPGDVEAYLAHKERRNEELERQQRKLDAKRRHLQGFVDRFRAKASKASQAQSKLKQIARLAHIEIEHPAATVRIVIPAPKIKKGIALRCEDLSIGYAERTVAAHVTIDLERGRHIAVLGDNGQGKTTLLRTVAGLQGPLAGSYRWGHDLAVAYYGERVVAAMDGHDTVRAYLLRHAAPGVLPEAVFAMAGNFLFGEHDLDKRVEILSGGERSRLCLAGLLLTGSTVFLLDEPTSHLDFETVEALGEALREHPGTIVFVSHDRTFVNLVATAIVEVADGRVRAFPGTYEEYVYALGERDDGPRPAPASEAPKPVEEQRTRREVHEETKAQKRTLKKIEERVAEAEQERESILARMALNPTVYSPTLTKRLHDLNELIAKDEEEWFRVRQAIEWLEKE